MIATELDSCEKGNHFQKVKIRGLTLLVTNAKVKDLFCL